MIKLKSLLLEIYDSYRGLHTAPDPNNGAPLYDVTKIYPSDIYTLGLITSARYYGEGRDIDLHSISIIRSAYKKPNAKIKIYRAVPNLSKDIDDKLKYYNNIYNHVERFGFPSIKDREASGKFHDMGYNKEKYLEFLRDIIVKLSEEKKKIKINHKQWRLGYY